MPWENKGGSGGGNGGPWGGGSGGGDGPWGRGGGGAPGGGRKPPDFEDFIRKGQDRFRRMMPGGRRFGPSGVFLVLLALQKDLGTLHHSGERQFWNDLTLAFGCWFLVSVIRLFQPDFCRYGGRAAGEQGHDQNASQAHDD